LYPAQPDEVRFGRELFGLQLRHPQQIPATRLVLDGRDLQRCGSIIERLLIQRARESITPWCGFSVRVA
jgi:hypothetical protein